MRIRQLRDEQKLTQEQLGLMVGIDRSHISRIERGVCNPTLDILILISNGLDVTPSHLLSGIGFPTTSNDSSSVTFVSPKNPNRNYRSTRL